MLFVYLLWHYVLWGRYAYQCLLYSDEYLRVDTMGKERPRQCDYYFRYHPSRLANLHSFRCFSLVFVTAVYYLKPYIKNNFSMQGISLGFHNFLPTEYVDVFTTSIFLIGMWLMAKRKVENWVFWILGDLISVPLYLKKGNAIHLLSVLFIHHYCHYGL